MASGNDMKAANATYAGFIGMLRWIVPTVAIATLIIVILISS